MNRLRELAEDLAAHRKLCEEILTLLEREHAALRASSSGSGGSGPAGEARRKFLSPLSQSVQKLKEGRHEWLKLAPEERQQHSQIADLLRQNQNVVTRILMLDREIEQQLLRQGLVPPQHLPPANRQRPHFVASMYQRNSLVLAQSAQSAQLAQLAQSAHASRENNGA